MSVNIPKFYYLEITTDKGVYRLRVSAKEWWMYVTATGSEWRGSGNQYVVEIGLKAEGTERK